MTRTPEDDAVAAGSRPATTPMRKGGTLFVIPTIGRELMTNHPRVPMSRSGFCQFPSTAEHGGCRKSGCDCDCHLKEGT